MHVDVSDGLPFRQDVSIIDDRRDGVLRIQLKDEDA